MLSFFGYPDAKLSEWGGKAEPSQLKERLDSFFATVFAIIEQGQSTRQYLHNDLDLSHPNSRFVREWS